MHTHSILCGATDHLAFSSCFPFSAFRASTDDDEVVVTLQYSFI